MQFIWLWHRWVDLQFRAGITVEKAIKPILLIAQISNKKLKEVSNLTEMI